MVFKAGDYDYQFPVGKMLKKCGSVKLYYFQTLYYISKWFLLFEWFSTNPTGTARSGGLFEDPGGAEELHVLPSVPSELAIFVCICFTLPWHF